MESGIRSEVYRDNLFGRGIPSMGMGGIFKSGKPHWTKNWLLNKP